MSNYKIFTNRSCEFFPCHSEIDKKEFNCLFCWCPLYCLGEECGGNYRYLDSGVKDCSMCKVPHKKDNYDYIVSRFSEVMNKSKKKG